MKKANFSAVQSKAARALLGWSQGDLAKKASLAVSTVADFERGQRSPVPNNMEAMRQAFEASGVRFTLGGAVVEAERDIGIRSRVPFAELRPVRWVDETMLNEWADRVVARQELPELLRRLLLARFGYGAEIRFPSEESSQLRGWDGLTNVRSTDPLIPAGRAAWEMGVNKAPQKKADADYEKRCSSFGGIHPAETVFVFVTPRAWGAKEEWVAKRRREKRWRDVQVVDAIDLVALLEQTPAVALWLANKTNRMPENVRSLPDAWKEWSHSTALHLSESLILSGRDDESAMVHRWLKAPAESIAIQAESTIEALAFLHASISIYPSAVREMFDSRVLLAGSEDTARQIANVPLPLIIAGSEMDPGVAALLVSKGHHVFLAYGSAIAAPVDVRILPRPDRYVIADELEALEVDEEEAHRLARDSGRSLTVLRRLVKAAPGQMPPTWARSDQARRFLPILLVGAWDERNEADKRSVSELAGIPYDDLRENLTAGLLLPESPVRNVGSIWKIASPRDAWFRLSPYLTPSDVEGFKRTALKVLGSVDPTFERAENRWLSFDDERPETNSFYLKQGLVETITLIGVFGKQHRSLPHLEYVSDHLIEKLLKGAGEVRWWSLARHLKELAEASPRAFLDSVNDSLDKNNPPIMALFKERDDGIFGSADHANLLWALEMLAWEPDHLAHVTSVLLSLAEIDPQGRWTNRPANSLRQIYLLWHPQTYASQEERLTILNAMRKRHPKAIWDLILGLYPKAHDSTSNTPKPLWRSFDEPKQREPITHRSIWTAATKLGEWLLADVGIDPKRWEEAVHRFSDFSPELRQDFAKLASMLPRQLTSEPDRERVRAALRRFIHDHREYSETDWAVPEDELVTLERVHNRLESKDPVTKFRWLFLSREAPLLDPAGPDLKESEDASREARRCAMENILKIDDLAGVWRLAESGVLPGLVGQAVADASDDRVIDRVLGDLFSVGNDIGLGVAFGVVASRGERGDLEWSNRLIDRALQEAWSDKAIGAILSALPQSVDLHERIQLLPASVQNSFWQTVSPYSFRVSGDELAWVIDGLVSHERAYDAAALLVVRKAKIDSARLVRILYGILATQDRLTTNGNSTMVQRHVAQIFLRLDKDEDFSRDELGRLEWAYLRLLNHSKRPPRTLYHRLATNPHFFCEVISTVYRAKDAPSEDLSEEDQERQQIIVNNAFTLLHSWREIPGSDGASVRYDVLEHWVMEARQLCTQSGRGEIADQKIGEVLAHAPEDADGTWPCEPVRKLIENVRSSDIDAGFYIGTLNKRGVTSRGPLDGGELERQEAARYRAQAKTLRFQWPCTATILERVARNYDADAEEHDQEVERRQWR